DSLLYCSLNDLIVQENIFQTGFAFFPEQNRSQICINVLYYKYRFALRQLLLIDEQTLPTRKDRKDGIL
ncbi:hypothetical protein RYX45_24405, partial [Alkalihalophilus pseudofirmus]